MVGRVFGWRENLTSASKCGESSKETSPKSASSTCVFYTWYASTPPRYRSRRERQRHRNLHRHPVKHIEIQPSCGHSSEETRSMSSVESDHTELLSRLNTQVEFYFSTENLARDVYLRSLLSSSSSGDGPAAPLAIIAKFNKVRSLTQTSPSQDELQLLQRALANSTNLKLSSDGLWIIPLSPLPPLDVSTQAEVSSSSSSTSLNSTSAPTVPLSQLKERNTLLVRDVPSNATTQQILESFTLEGIVPKHACPADATNNAWYVTFNAEPHAIKAAENSKDVQINGTLIKASILDNLPPNANAPVIAATYVSTPQTHVPHHMHPMSAYPSHHLHHSTPVYTYATHHVYPPQQGSQYHPSQHMQLHYQHHPQVHDVHYTHHQQHHYPQHVPIYHYQYHDGHPVPLYPQVHALHPSRYQYHPHPAHHVNVPSSSVARNKPKKDSNKKNRHKKPYRGDSPVHSTNNGDSVTSNVVTSQDTKASSKTQKGSLVQSMKDIRLESYSHPKMKKASSIQAEGIGQSANSNKSSMNGKKGTRKGEMLKNSSADTKLKEDPMKQTDLQCNINFPALGGSGNEKGCSVAQDVKEDEDANAKDVATEQDSAPVEKQSNERMTTHLSGYAQALLRSSSASTATNTS
mmetsp:Transcript_15296/g.22779  ORF Transcript_15296/g.22779 Transcript_15296/m.22779 type:complete len:633 (-) Transcript_15296:687-2585(-)